MIIENPKTPALWDKYFNEGESYLSHIPRTSLNKSNEFSSIISKKK